MSMNRHIGRAASTLLATSSSSSSLTRQTAVLAHRFHPFAGASASIPSTTHASFHTTPLSFKPKKSSVNNISDPGDQDDVAESDVPVIRTRGKGPKGAKKTTKGAKSKSGRKEEAELQDDSRNHTTTQNQSLPDENFDKEATKQHMTRMVERCRQTVTKMVGSHGRADPALLDSVKVGLPEGDEKFPLRDFASVGTRDGALIVTLYDPDMLKHVERGIYLADLGLNPQHAGSADEAILRIPVPKATAETREKMLKDINRICENARSSIRVGRQNALKQIKRDVDSKVVGDNEAKKEQKLVEDETKARQKEVEDFYNSIKKKLESESDS